MTSPSTRFFEKNKNRIVGLTFVLTFLMFFFFSLMDLQKRMSDYQFFAKKINGIIHNTYESEMAYLDLRIMNYIESIMAENDIARHIIEGNEGEIGAAFEPVYRDFHSRAVPVISMTVIDTDFRPLFSQQDPHMRGSYPNHSLSSMQAAFEKGRPTSGFEFGDFPLHYGITLPVVNKTDGQIVGAVEIGLNPAWFHFKMGWFLEGIKTAIVTRDHVLNDDSRFASMSEKVKRVFNNEKRRQDVAFFQSIMGDIDFGKEVVHRKVDGRHYIISTYQKMFSHDGVEVGKLLVAYDMSDFWKRQWDYFYLWVVFFACTALVLFLITYFGFRKYDQILSAQGKKLAHRSKQSALGEMIGYIGHQWRQPLNALSLTIQNIELQNKLGKLDDSLIKKQVAAANRNIQYLTTIIEDWRALLSTGTTRQTIELSDSVSRAIGIVHPVLEQNRIFIANCVTGPIYTHGFINDLVQLTVNVLLNAKDALVSRADGRLIHLSNRREGDFVIVEFQDSGGGIPQKLLARVFEPYLTTKGDTAGTGLGLYLCRQIAENLDEGEVWAENRKFEFDGKPYYGACICLKFKPIGGENSREY